MRSSPWRFATFLFLTLLFQITLPQAWSVFSYCDLFILMAFQMGLRSRGTQALFYGFTIGLLQDLTLSSMFPVGIQALAKMNIAGLSCQLSRRMNFNSLLLQSGAVFLYSVLNLLLIAAFYIIFGKTSPLQSTLPILFSGAVNVVINIPVWASSERFV